MGGFQKVKKRKKQHFFISMIIGIVIGAVVSPSSLPFKVLISWDIGALLFLASLFYLVVSKDNSSIEEFGESGPKPTYIDIVLILASLASIIAVGLMFVADETTISEMIMGLLSIVISWLVVHTVFTFLYIERYKKEGQGSIDFNGCKNPDFWDFAYVSFTIGMTYQISDTNVHSSKIRRLVLKHALLSFLFGTAIIATSINLVVGLVGK